ncbi:hypothetical protein CICLE_v100337991mg, partial [Citrus x clementina]
GCHHPGRHFTSTWLRAIVQVCRHPQQRAIKHHLSPKVIFDTWETKRV